MEKISNYINILFKKLFDGNKHPFYKDMENVIIIKNEHFKSKSKIIRNQIDFQPNIKIPNELKLEIEESIEELDLNLLNELSKEFKRSKNIKKIISLVNRLHSQNIPSNNLLNLEEILINYKNSDKINIAIIGAGPVGLFLACYLYKYYNSSYGLSDFPKVNIIVFDNRIINSGLKKPYTRKRNFSFNSSYLSYIIPNIYSWEDQEYQDYLLNIYILEYILFTKAYHEYNIPFIFDNYSWSEYTRMFEKGNFKVVFDCTGGRLSPNIFKIKDTKWISDIFKKYDSLLLNLKIDKQKNLIYIENDSNKFKKNYYYGNINIYKLEFGDLKFVEKFDINIDSSHDLKLFIGIKKKFYSLQSTKKIIKKIKSNIERNFIHNILEEYDDDLIFQFDIFNTNMRHAIEISKVIKIKNHKVLYIGAGDTIFHSHFTTGSGLNRVLSFAVKCANFITSLSLE